MVISAQARLATLTTLLVLLGVATLITIVLVLSGIESEGAAKLSGTSSLFILFTATFLVSAISFERRALPGIGIVGMASSPLAFILGLLLVYGAIEPTSFSAVKPVLIFGILAFVGAWASAVAAQRGGEGPVEMAVWATVGALGLVALIAIVLILSESQPGSGVGKLLGVLSSLAVLGTFAVPMLRKSLGLREEASVGRAEAEPHPPAEPGAEG